MHFPDIKRQAGLFLQNNATTILTAGGVIGTTMTAILAGKGGFKAALIIRDVEELRATHREANGEDDENEPMTAKEKVLAVWPQFIPPVVLGTATVGSIVAANMMSAKRAAALAAAYGISERNLREYKEKTLEKLGINKERAVRDEIAQDRVNSNPPTKEVIILAGGDVLCFDMTTGRYFRSSVETIKRAEVAINQELFNHQYASLSAFYDEINLPPTSFSDEVGWNSAQTGPVEIRFSTVMSPDEQPCIAIDFTVPPKTDYTQMY